MADGPKTEPLTELDTPPQEAPTSEPRAARRSLKKVLLGTVRGKVLLLLCLMYFITYTDRVNIATTAPFIKHDLGLSATQLGLAFSAFSVPYAFFQIFGGVIGDRYGPRKVLGVVGLLWALATAATGFVVNLGSLFAARLALGFGEGSSFPTATQAMSRWMPEDRRGFAQGVVHSAARLGNAITPLVIAVIIGAWGWRAAFWVGGAASVLWVIAWVLYFRDCPSDHPKVTDDELTDLESYQSQPRVRTPVPWGPLVKRLMPVTFVDFCYGWMLWVYLTWIPSYFKGNFGLNLTKFALFSSLVLLAGVVGDSFGGMFSDAVLRRTGNLKLARRLVLVVGLLGSFVFIIPTILFHQLLLDTVCLALAFFFLELTNAVLWAIPMDIAPQHAGTAGGLMNTGFGVAGVVSPLLFGILLDRTGSWQVPFAVSSVLLFIGAAASLFMDPTRPLDVQVAPESP